MEDIIKKINCYAQRVENELEKVMNVKQCSLSSTLLSSMKYTLFSGGKRLRPVLTMMTADMMHGDMNSAVRAGAALELIHTYSLIHDDLPGMDDDDLRRGSPTNHKVYGTGIAILAGDGLLTYAFSLLSRLDLPSEKKIKIIEVVSTSAGPQGMVGGQTLDLEAEGEDISLEELIKIHQAKTGALFNSAILAGAYCAETAAKDIELLNEFSIQLGILFQIVDDILDVTGDEEKLGKNIGSDEKLNKSTYPSLLGIEGAREEAQKRAGKAKKLLDVIGEKSEDFKQLIDYMLIRQS